MLPKHQQHRKHREQIGRKPADEPGLDLEHARIASSKASHALTSSIGKVMAGNVARTSSTPKEKIMFVIWYMHENDEQQTSLEILGRDRAQFVWDSLHESGYMLLSTRP